MIIWGMMTWWYGAGWRQCLDQVKDRIAATLDYFSVGLLIKTLVAPYRQISASQVRGSLDVQIRAFFDRLISRFVGLMLRLIMIGVGTIIIFFNIVIGGVLLIFWAFVPLLPIVGLILFLLGWMPWSN